MKIIKLAAVLILLLQWQSAWASFDPAQWVSLTIEVKQLTLDGMYSQLDLLQAGADGEAIMAQDATTQNQVDEAYQNYGITVVEYAQQAQTNAAQIDNHLTTNPAMQTQLDNLNNEFNLLVEALRATQGAAE